MIRRFIAQTDFTLVIPFALLGLTLCIGYIIVRGMQDRKKRRKENNILRKAEHKEPSDLIGFTSQESNETLSLSESQEKQQQQIRDLIKDNDKGGS